MKLKIYIAVSRALSIVSLSRARVVNGTKKVVIGPENGVNDADDADDA